MTETSTNSYRPNRRFRLPTNPWLKYVGNCAAVDDFLSSKDGWGWMFPKFMNALFRGVGQVVFCNNPFTGLIILLSLFWSDPVVGLATVLAASTAILTAIIFRQDPAHIRAGLTTYNAVLVGSVTAALWTPLYKMEISFLIWAFIILGAALSVFVNSAISNLLSSFKQPLPSLTFPFNIVTMLLFTCLMPSPVPLSPSTGLLNSTSGLGGVAMELVARPVDLPVNNSISRTTREADNTSGIIPSDADIAKIYVKDDQALHWGSILLGILLSMGQVYGVNNLVASVMMYFATMIYSPTICMMSAMGAIVGTIFGITFTNAPYGSVYDGLWGFNGILSATAIAGFFVVLTCHSFWSAIANILLTVLIQHALAIAFAPAHLPFFTMPFVLSSFIFLQLTATGNNYVYVKNITSPEVHRLEYRQNLAMSTNENGGNRRDTTDEIAEEKELVLKDVKVIIEDTPKDENNKEENKAE